MLDAASAAVAEAAARAKLPGPPEPAVRAFFSAQIEAAKQVQQTAARAEAPPDDGIPDLDDDLRPALLRIGEQIAVLLIALPPDLDPTLVASVARDGLRSSYLDEPSGRALSDAIVAVSRSRSEGQEPAAPTEKPARP